MSMLSNHFISEVLGFSHRDAWIITMLWTGIFNYFMLKASWRRPKIEVKSSVANISAIEPVSDRDRKLSVAVDKDKLAYAV